MKAFVSLPSAGLLVGVCREDMMLVLLCVEGLVTVDVLLRGLEVRLEALCCVAVVTGVVVRVRW